MDGCKKIPRKMKKLAKRCEVVHMIPSMFFTGEYSVIVQHPIQIQQKDGKETKHLYKLRRQYIKERKEIAKRLSERLVDSQTNDPWA